MAAMEAAKALGAAREQLSAMPIQEMHLSVILCALSGMEL